ncbi:MAG TPA: GAF and ANTAR domain-containing protein [Acidimicrobiales bacterium]|nr:GAF and ANTAR domain-containing protein [Acidimicrobiales bacterium]
MVETSENQGMIDHQPETEIAENLVEMGQILLSVGTSSEVLIHLVRLAVAAIERCEFAGLLLTDKSAIATPVNTDPIIGEIADFQHEIGEGPCFDAIVRQQIFFSDDLSLEDRWPTFGPYVVEHGMRSVLAVPLSNNEDFGALGLYSRYVSAFGVIDRAQGAILASMAGFALAAIIVHDDNIRLAENLRQALTNREIIGQAQGVLMERERITADQAFDILRRASQHLNRKLRSVAQDLVDSGESPDTG